MAKINTVTVDVENNIYPAYGFFFQVNFLDISSSDLNTRFQSVNGISKTSKSKKIANGGYNDYEYKLPINASYKDITLKRGIIKSNSDNSKDIIHWLENLENFYHMNFNLMTHWNWSLTEIENMLPWEREIYINLLINHLEDEKQRQKNG